MVQPVLKWAGGKRQILPQIKGVFPVEEEYNNYIEPFVGGGAVFFDLEPEAGVINDLNTRLMNFYRVVREQPEELIEHAEEHDGSEEYYYDARDRFNEIGAKAEIAKDNVEEASLLLYLNRTCYNGLYRVNSKGEFNVPYGDNSDRSWIMPDRIRAVSDVLAGTTLRNEDFAKMDRHISANDLVYLDPPYKPVSDTSFAEYQSDEFGQEQQKNLSQFAEAQHEKGAYVVISNSPPVAELYEDIDGFEVIYIGARRTINCNADGRGEVKEILVTNVPPNERRRKTLSEYAEQQD